MESEYWIEVREFILETLNLIGTDFDKQSVDAVMHYVDHDEYEMAFEGLFIEVMKHNLNQKIDYNKALKLGQEMNLRDESTFDSNFWIKFETFCYNGILNIR